ncbi:MAG: exonuclease SbcCD subunit D [Chloroflexota bacterium]|nr:exonuclease SbcCD subunit D [Chloroflexota bacterium]
MIKLLHFADVHLGAENYGRWDPETGLPIRLMDFLRALDQIVERALAEEVDLAIFAGDAYQSRDPTPTYQREFAARIRRLAQTGTPVVLVAGNHDTPHAIGRANTIEIFDTLAVENVHVVQRPRVLALSTKSGPVQVVGLPWIVRSKLLAREEYKGLSLEEVNNLITDKITNIVADLQEGLISQLETSIPTVFTAHGTVQGATYSSERSVMLGREVILPPSLVTNPAFDYVALGHIHKHQVLHNHPPVVYSGSIERMDFGEEGERKGFVLAQVESGGAEWGFIPLPVRPFVTIEVEAGGPDPTAQVIEAIEEEDIGGAVVRLIIHTNAEWEPLLRDEDIRQALEPAFHLAALVRDVERPTRLRLGGRAAAGLEPEELLKRYLKVKGTRSERAEVLLEHAKSIFE